MMDKTINCGQKRVEIYMEDPNELIEHSIAMFGKAYNSIYRKLNILTAIMKELKKKVDKITFYKKVTIRSEDKFRDDWMSTINTDLKYT